MGKVTVQYFSCFQSLGTSMRSCKVRSRQPFAPGHPLGVLVWEGTGTVPPLGLGAGMPPATVKELAP